MFIGHFAVAFAAKRAAPRTSLAMTFIGAQLADLLWPIFLLLGIEQVRIAPTGNPFLTLEFTHYPWSHSLVMQVLWGVLLGALYYAVTRYRQGAIAVGLLVPSHWLFDLVVHVPDLPLYPGAANVLGLSVWRSPTTTAILECVLYLAGVVVYARTTRPVDRVGRYGFLALVVFLLVLYGTSIVSPPPPSVSALAWGALIGWPLSLWPWWVDRHRDVVAG